MKTTIKQSQVRGLAETLNSKQNTLVPGSGIEIEGNTISAVPTAVPPMIEWLEMDTSLGEDIPSEVGIKSTSTVEVYKNGLLMRPATGTPGSITFSSPSTTISEWKAYSGTVDFKVNGTDVSVTVDFSSLGDNDDLHDVARLISSASSSATNPFACFVIEGDTPETYTGLVFVSASTGTSSTITLQDSPESAWTTLLGGNGTAVAGTNDEESPAHTNINDVYVHQVAPTYILLAEQVTSQDNICVKLYI